ncbi:helix-turn-helix domain-containing protein [Lactococcus ileimucosae]|uniref:helix-turn-helix domain-containing protein n=1 Tax=Lactococcus ileimucosae TaxID=2941329 RepID=UPI002044A7AA|nr:helix-turn-helix domain-containing protein [Lactococcus ileimucosae]
MAQKGSQFKKYDYKFKLKAVEKYLSGEYGSQRQTCLNLGIRSVTQLKKWLALYKENIKLNEMSLEDQNKFLRMENDILKKYQALLKTLNER